MDTESVDIIPASEVPEGAMVFPAVVSTKRKRCQKTGEVHRHKARINLDRSKQKSGLHYDQTYAPVASWESIRFTAGAGFAKRLDNDIARLSGSLSTGTGR